MDDFPELTKASSPNEAVFFEGESTDFTSIDGHPYYVRITKRCISPSFDVPFVSLYFQCDEAEAYECLMYVLMNEDRTVALDVDRTEASDDEMSNILDYVEKNKELWVSSAEASDFYISLENFNHNLREI